MLLFRAKMMPLISRDKVLKIEGKRHLSFVEQLDQSEYWTYIENINF